VNTATAAMTTTRMPTTVPANTSTRTWARCCAGVLGRERNRSLRATEGHAMPAGTPGASPSSGFRGRSARAQNVRVNGIGLRMRMSSSNGMSTYGRLNARNFAGFCVWNSASPKNSTPKTMIPVIEAIIVA
jgi:hypothetical protein